MTEPKLSVVEQCLRNARDKFVARRLATIRSMLTDLRPDLTPEERHQLQADCADVMLGKL